MRIENNTLNHLNYKQLANILYFKWLIRTTFNSEFTLTENYTIQLSKYDISTLI